MALICNLLFFVNLLSTVKTQKAKPTLFVLLLNWIGKLGKHKVSTTGPRRLVCRNITLGISRCLKLDGFNLMAFTTIIFASNYIVDKQANPESSIIVNLQSIYGFFVAFEVTKPSFETNNPIYLGFRQIKVPYVLFCNVRHSLTD